MGTLRSWGGKHLAEVRQTDLKPASTKLARVLVHCPTEMGTPDYRDLPSAASDLVHRELGLVSRQGLAVRDDGRDYRYASRTWTVTWSPDPPQNMARIVSLERWLPHLQHNNFQFLGSDRRIECWLSSLQSSRGLSGIPCDSRGVRGRVTYNACSDRAILGGDETLNRIWHLTQT